MNTPTTCPVCASGSIFCRNGEVVKCPKCRGTGFIYPTRTIATEAVSIVGIVLTAALILAILAFA